MLERYNEVIKMGIRA